MSYAVKYTLRFAREAKRLGKRYASIADDIEALTDSLIINPFQGADLGGGVRKIRMPISAKHKGKSGGARVITVNAIVGDDGIITMALIYDKSERESISKKEIKLLIEEAK